MHPAYGAPVKKTASTRLRQYNVEPPCLPLEITSAQALSQPCYNSSGRHYRVDERLHTHYRYQVYQTLTNRCTGLFFFIPNKSGRLDKAVKVTFCPVTLSVHQLNINNHVRPTPTHNILEIYIFTYRYYDTLLYRLKALSELFTVSNQI